MDMSKLPPVPVSVFLDETATKNAIVFYKELMTHQHELEQRAAIEAIPDDQDQQNVPIQ